jgi:modulator of FtsH protease HflK
MLQCPHNYKPNSFLQSIQYMSRFPRIRFFNLNDPGWGRGGKEPPKKPSGGDGPTDLDELWRDFNRKLNGMFGKKSGAPNPGGNGGGDSGGGGGGRPGPSMPSGRVAGMGIGLLLGAALLLWLASGFYILPEGQAAAVFRFGELREVVDKAGFKWRLPSPIESHTPVNAQQLRQVEVGYRGNVKSKSPKEALMLTRDQSIVDLQFAVQYRLSNVKDWLLNNNPGRQPEELLRQGAETAMRQVVGRKGIDQVLYEEKEAIAKEALKAMQTIVDRYQAGVTIVDVTIQQAQPPQEVQAAFEDANKAAQDRERLINEGRAYANDVIPKARGTAARLGQEAEGHKQRVVAIAEGDSDRFKKVLVEYNKAPQVTRDRMYLEAMQQVFANTSKVYNDSKGSGSLLYLPLDKLMGQGGEAASQARQVAPAAAAPEAPKNEVSGDAATRARDGGLRSRERP